MGIVIFDEVMVHLKSFGKERFFQSPVLEATFGEAETSLETYPNFEKITITLWQSKSADSNIRFVVLNNCKEYINLLCYKVDRIVNGGASVVSMLFASGKYKDNKTSINFAVAERCLKHSISDDL